MVGRSLRVAFLALAAWAVLFAPAAASEHGGQATRMDPDRVAPAVLAPTFGPGGAVLAGSVRVADRLPSDCSNFAGDVATRPPTVRPSDYTAAASDSPDSSASDEGMGRAPTRAPPQD